MDSSFSRVLFVFKWVEQSYVSKPFYWRDSPPPLSAMSLVVVKMGQHRWKCTRLLMIAISSPHVIPQLPSDDRWSFCVVCLQVVQWKLKVKRCCSRAGQYRDAAVDLLHYNTLSGVFSDGIFIFSHLRWRQNGSWYTFPCTVDHR